MEPYVQFRWDQKDSPFEIVRILETLNLIICLDISIDTKTWLKQITAKKVQAGLLMQLREIWWQSE